MPVGLVLRIFKFKHRRNSESLINFLLLSASMAKYEGSGCFILKFSASQAEFDIGKILVSWLFSSFQRLRVPLAMEIFRILTRSRAIRNDSQILSPIFQKESTLSPTSNLRLLLFRLFWCYTTL